MGTVVPVPIPIESNRYVFLRTARAIKAGRKPGMRPYSCALRMVWFGFLVALTHPATSVLFPGQTHGGDYKPHGGLRFDGPGQGPDIEIFVPMDATVRSAARYLQFGVVQHVFEFVNECGVMYRLDHLLDLSPRFQQLADTLPQGGEGQRQGTSFPPGIRVRAGELIATTIGVPGNVFFDWGVYDLRSMNAASNDAVWLAAHPGDQAPYAICWLEFLSPAATAALNLLPLPVSEDGSMSDYCN
jgi:hypothetical protein